MFKTKLTETIKNIPRINIYQLEKQFLCICEYLIQNKLKIRLKYYENY